MDPDNARVAGTQGGSSSTMTKQKQVGNVKLVPRSAVNNTQEPRMTVPNQVCSPSPTWSYHSNWSDNLSPPHIIPLLHLIVINPCLGGAMQGQLIQGQMFPCLSLKHPVLVFLIGNQDPLDLKGVEVCGPPKVIVPQCLVMGEVLVKDSLSQVVGEQVQVNCQVLIII